MLHKYLDPKNDVAFRKIFGTEKNKDILIHFLNDMAMFKDKPLIKSIDFLKTIQDPEIAAKKTSIVDILCKDAKGRQYIVEMRVLQHKRDVERILSHSEYGSYVKDEGRPFKIGFQEQILNYLKLLWEKFKVVSVKEKSV
jgi:hypothetical protein